MSQEELICFLLETQSLTFGFYKTRSGRDSPYYLNTGVFSNIDWLSKIAQLYCEKIQNKGWTPTYLFGPAYKGIGLSIGTGFAYMSKGIPMRVGSARKEEKNHGDKGIFVGTPVTATDKVVIIDDVLTAGISLQKSYDLLKKTGATILGCVVLLDRQEQSEIKKLSARAVLQEQGIEVLSILTIKDILESKLISSHLQNNFDENFVKKIQTYRQQFNE